MPTIASSPTSHSLSWTAQTKAFSGKPKRNATARRRRKYVAPGGSMQIRIDTPKVICNVNMDVHESFGASSSGDRSFMVPLQEAVNSNASQSWVALSTRGVPFTSGTDNLPRAVGARVSSWPSIVASVVRAESRSWSSDCKASHAPLQACTLQPSRSNVSNAERNSLMSSSSLFRAARAIAMAAICFQVCCFASFTGESFLREPARAVSMAGSRHRPCRRGRLLGLNEDDEDEEDEALEPV
mmetsp:Transcript_35488/g.81219  ORF Transcript_35488/g.81219 Transcript_35488/m.81219 type:complete len:241 (-) Transcript_35488:1186-1908(-)